MTRINRQHVAIMVRLFHRNANRNQRRSPAILDHPKQSDHPICTN